MPHYDYTCQAGHKFEEYQSITAEPLAQCKCGAPARRLIGTGGALIFKGSGFYCTDYGKKAPPPKEAE